MLAVLYGFKADTLPPTPFRGRATLGSFCPFIPKARSDETHSAE